MCEEISAGAAEPTEHIKNSRARVTEWKFARKGKEHDVTNGNEFACSFIEVELIE